MKKLFSLVIALVISLTLVSASAVTFDIPYGTTTTTTMNSGSDIRTEEEVRFILSKSGKPVGVLTAHEGEYRNNLGKVSYSGNTVTSAMSNGKVVRAKNVATVTLDADDHVFHGSSTVTGTFEILDASVKDYTAKELVDLTISVVYDNGDGTFVAYHRFIDNDNKGTKVALFHLPSGKKVSIWLTDWNGDGVRNEYALRAGTAPNSSSPDSSSGSSGSSSGSSGGSSGGNNGGDHTPSLKDNPGESSSSSGSSSSGSSSSSGDHTPGLRD